RAPAPFTQAALLRASFTTRPQHSRVVTERKRRLFTCFLQLETGRVNRFERPVGKRSHITRRKRMAAAADRIVFLRGADTLITVHQQQPSRRVARGHFGRLLANGPRLHHERRTEGTLARSSGVTQTYEQRRAGRQAAEVDSPRTVRVGGDTLGATTSPYLPVMAEPHQ